MQEFVSCKNLAIGLKSGLQDFCYCRITGKIILQDCCLAITLVQESCKVSVLLFL